HARRGAARPAAHAAHATADQRAAADAGDAAEADRAEGVVGADAQVRGVFVTTAAVVEKPRLGRRAVQGKRGDAQEADEETLFHEGPIREAQGERPRPPS